MNRVRIGNHFFNTFLYIIMTVIGVVTLYPFLNVLAISLNDAADSIKGGIYLLPRRLTFQNYYEVFQYPDLLQSLLISVLRTVIGTVTSVLSASMLAYVISRNNFSGRRIISILFVITMYIDGGMVPNFMLVKWLNLYNNFLVYILPGLVSVFYVMLIRTFIESLGPSLQESAQIDGANDMKIFFHIIFPLCAPVIATVALYSAVGQWNSWFDTYIYTNGGASLSTLQFQLMRILQNTTVTGNVHIDRTNAPKISPESIRMTVTIIATLPILIVYPFLQKYFVKGMMIGAIKS